MTKGWKKDSARHALAAKGVKTRTREKGPKSGSRRILDLTSKDIQVIQKIIADSLEKEQIVALGETSEAKKILGKYGYTKGTEFLHTDELVEEIVLPMLRSKGYKDAIPVVGEQLTGMDKSPETTVWVELRGWVIDVGSMVIDREDPTLSRKLFRKDSEYYRDNYTRIEDTEGYGKPIKFSRETIERLKALADQTPDEVEAKEPRNLSDLL